MIENAIAGYRIPRQRGSRGVWYFISHCHTDVAAAAPKTQRSASTPTPTLCSELHHSPPANSESHLVTAANAPSGFFLVSRFQDMVLVVMLVSG
jgi:hypothetical protein